MSGAEIGLTAIGAFTVAMLVVVLVLLTHRAGWKRIRAGFFVERDNGKGGDDK